MLGSRAESTAPKRWGRLVAQWPGHGLAATLAVLLLIVPAAGQADFRPLNPEEQAYWRFAQASWDRIDWTAEVINQPSRARSLADMTREVSTRTEVVTDELWKLRETLIGARPPPLFANYHHHMVGFVEALWTLTANYHVMFLEIDHGLYEADQQARGDRAQFERLAGRAIGRVENDFGALNDRHIRNMDRHLLEMEREMKFIGIPVGESPGSGNSGGVHVALSFQPFFLPIAITIGSDGVDVELTGQVTTPLGTISASVSPSR